MSTLSRDTQLEAERVQIELLRRATGWRKFHMVGEMNKAVCTLALRGLSAKYPYASQKELYRHLGDLWLGTELNAKVHTLTKYEEKRMASEPIAVTLMVAEVMEKLGVPYFLGGSLASAFYGTLRATMDADLVADLRAEHIRPFVTALKDKFYVDPEAVSQAVLHQKSFNLIHLESMFKVDVFIRGDRPFDQAQFKRRIAHIVDVDSYRALYIASMEDMILSKLEWYQSGGRVSDRQWQDVLGILKVQGNELDYSYLRHWAKELHVAELLEQAMTEVH